MTIFLCSKRGVELPPHLICVVLSYLSLENLTANVYPTCYLLYCLSKSIIGAEDVEREAAAMVENTMTSSFNGLVRSSATPSISVASVSIRQMVPGVGQVLAYPQLRAAYARICQLRNQFDIMRWRELGEVGSVNEESGGAKHGTAVVALSSALEHFCQERYFPSQFDKLVTPDDNEIQDFLGVEVIDYERRGSTLCFRRFCELQAKVEALIKARYDYLSCHFAFVSAAEAEAKAEGRHQQQQGQNEPPLNLSAILENRDNDRHLQRGRLTTEGSAACNAIFNHFDVGNDGVLGWKELSAINQAAGIPLSHSAFSWVQQSYEVNDQGKLTRNGYRAMFLENFIRVPRLMYKDLCALSSFIANEKALQQREQQIDNEKQQKRNTNEDISKRGPPTGRRRLTSNLQQDIFKNNDENINDENINGNINEQAAH